MKNKDKVTYKESFNKGNYPDVYGLQRLKDLISSNNIIPTDVDINALGEINDGEKCFFTITVTYKPI